MDQITTQRSAKEFEAFCNQTVTANSSESLESFCGCSNTVFTGIDIMDAQFKNFKMDGVVFNDVNFTNVSFSSVVFNGSQFVDCQFIETNFSAFSFNATKFEGVKFDSVSMKSSLLCSMNGSGVSVVDLRLIDVNINLVEVKDEFMTDVKFEQTLNQGSIECDDTDYKRIGCKAPDSQIYRDAFIITASAFPGNIAAAIGVYFIQRNLWLGKSCIAPLVV